MGSSQDIRAEVLSAFDADGDSAEPHTKATIVDALDIPEERVAEHLADLADSGDLEWKDIGDSRIWWPAQSLDGRTADDKPEPEQDRDEDSPKWRAQIRSHHVFDSKMIGVIVWGEDLTVKDANDTFLEMAGLNHEEALGTSWEELTPEEFYPASKRHISEVEESGSGVPYEKQYYHADGSRWWGLFESRQLNGGQKVELVVEITERRNREEELEAEQQFVQQSLDVLDDVFYVLDTDGRLQRWNDKAKTLTGYPESELADKSVLEFFPEDEHDKIGSSIERIWTEGTATVEADVLTAAGDRVPHEFRGKPLTDTDGNTTGIVGIGRDLTERRRRERRFQALVEESNDVISIVDTDGQFQYQSPSLERILGYQPLETIGDPAWEYIHPEDRETVMATFEEWLGSPEITDSIEYRAQHADGSWRWLEARGNNQLDNPAVEGYIVTSRDITDRRERQKTLEQIETLFEHAQDPLFIIDVAEEFTVERVNPAYEASTGLEREQVEGQTPTDLLGDELGADVEDKYRECVDRRESLSYEEQLQFGEQPTYWATSIAPVVVDDTVKYIVGSTKDITERVKREQERERQYEAIFNHTYQFTGLLDKDGTLIEANEAALEFGGLNHEDVIGKQLWNTYWWQVDDETTRELREAIDRAADGEFVRYDVEVQGEEENITIDFSIRPVTNDEDEVTYLIPEGRNITDLKTLQEQKQKLERQNDLFAKSQEIANIGAWEYNPHEQDNYFTDMVYEIYGVGPDHDFIREKDIQEFYHPEDRDKVRRATEEAVQSGEEYDIEVRITAADGTDKWVRAHGVPQVEDGTVQFVRGTFQDITERKEREQELENLKTQYQTLVENFPNGAVFLINSDLKCVRAGGEELNGVDLSSDKVEGTKPHALFPEEIADELCHYYESALDGNANTFEQGYGGERYRIQTVPIRTDGEINHLMAVSENITKRKERERELKRKTRAIEEAPVGISITDPSQNDNPMIYINQRFEEMTGYSREDVQGQNCRFLQGEETRSDPVAEIRQGIDDDQPVSVELRNYRKDGTEFWNHLEIAPVEDESGAVSNYVGFQQDVTDRKERERALEKRERILRGLNTATREFHPPESEIEIAEFPVEFVETAFEFEYVSVKRFDEQEGVLQSAARSSEHEETGEVGTVEPGSNPIWEAYRHGEPRLFDGGLLEEYGSLGVPANQILAVPIGEFGVLVTFTIGDSEFDDVDTDLIEVVATNAESAFQRLRSDSVRTELVDQLSSQQTRVAELRSVIDSVQAIQRRLASSESQDDLETGVCEELLETERVDFVWVGRPRSGDTDLRPTAWAGDGSDYLDSVETGTPDKSVPAQHAAANRESYCQQNIPSLVVDEGWAKDALSVGFHSVVSIPLVYDDVLYGVLTAYSRDEDAFGQMYEHLLTDVASLLMNHSRFLEHRFGDAQREYTELEFELSDPRYPLQRLASNTDSRVRFNTVAENMTDEIRILGTVSNGDPERVLDAASSMTSIVDAEQFGEYNQFSLTVQKPFLASVVGKHGGELVHAVSGEASTRFRVEVSGNTTKRPLLDALLSRYQSIELVAQRQTDMPRVPETERVADILTDRQYEILNAAYHGGYYETPRGVTGEDLAESFGISGPAVYNHLQSAHGALLETAMQQESDINDGE